MTYRNLILCCAIIKKVLKILSYLNRILNEVIIQAISPKSSKVQGKSMELFLRIPGKKIQNSPSFFEITSSLTILGLWHFRLLLLLFQKGKR